MSDDFASIPIQLPNIKTFHRPLWAYYHLDNAWTHLRGLLFGDTKRLITDLRAQGSKLMTPQQLKLFLKNYKLHPEIDCILVVSSPYKTAAELASWYARWEDAVFEEYITREKERERRDLNLQ